MFWLNVVWISGLPRAETFLWRRLFKGVGTLYESPRLFRSPSPERPTIGKRTTSPNESLYLRAPTLSSAVGPLAVSGQNLRPARLFSAKVRARKANELRTRK